MKYDPYIVLAAQVANKAAIKTTAWTGSEGSTPSAPLNDTFYSVDSLDISGSKLGSIINYREVGLANYENVKTAYQVLYRTENTFGEAKTALTTVIVPQNSDGEHVVSYQIPEDSSWLNCAPSWDLLQGGAEPDIQTLLDNGWVVNSPDYEGFNSSFTAGVLSGKLTLDSLRAVSNIGNMTGISDPKFALWGYSGGSIASGWAAELQEQYAPELPISGAAVGGYVVDLEATVLLVNKGLVAGFVPAGLLGLASEYTQLWDLFDQEVKSDKRAGLLKVLSQCVTADIIQFAGQDIFSIFNSGEAILNNTDVAKILSDNALGKVTPKIPLLVYQGVKDQVVPYKGVDKVVQYYCSNGGSVHYIRGANYDHTGMAAAYNATAIQWISDVFAGHSNSSCSYEGAPLNNTSSSNSTSPSNSTSASNSTASSGVHSSVASGAASGSAHSASGSASSATGSLASRSASASASGSASGTAAGSSNMATTQKASLVLIGALTALVFVF